MELRLIAKGELVSSAQQMANLPKYAHWESTGTFKISIVGTSSYHEVIASIAQNKKNVSALVTCIAYLVPENDNAHDINAVAVVIDGKKVGYLSRDYAKEYRSFIAQLPSHIENVSVAAAITNGISVEERTYNYTIELDIPDNLQIGMLSSPLSDTITRVNGFASLKREADGIFCANVWVPISDFSEIHKNRIVEEWTTDSWDTVNFYVQNRQALGLGFKVYQMPKPEYAKLLKDKPYSAKLVLGENRFATLLIRIEA